MNNPFSSMPFPNPFTMFSNMDSDGLKKYQLRARVYQAYAKFWGKLVMKGQLRFGKSGSGDKKISESQLTNYLHEFRKDMRKVYRDFKQDKRYDDLNVVEQFGDEWGKFMHRGMFWGGMNSQDRMYEVYNALEVLWDDFWGLEASEDDADFLELMQDFYSDVWEAFEFEGPVPEIEIAA